MPNPLVSLVITTLNEEKNIENCLQSIKSQTYPNIEIIVVDNFSTDKTQTIAKPYTELIFTKGPERSAQRNFGMIEKSQGEYVMFIDADMTLSPDLIAQCVTTMRDANIVALHVSEIVLGENFWSQVRRFERSFYDGTVIDGARFFRKNSFVAVGGFDETMSGPEDWDIDKKIKKEGEILLIPNEGTKAVIFHNEAEFNFKKYLKKKKYYSQSFDTYVAKWGATDPDIKKQLGLWYRYFGVFLEQDKWEKLFSHPILTVGLYFLRGVVGVVYLINKK